MMRRILGSHVAARVGELTSKFEDPASMDDNRTDIILHELLTLLFFSVQSIKGTFASTNMSFDFPNAAFATETGGTGNFMPVLSLLSSLSEIKIWRDSSAYLRSRSSIARGPWNIPG